MNKSKYILLIFVAVLLLTGCDNNSNETEEKTVTEDVETDEMVHKHCTRSSTNSGGVSTELSYEIYYTGEKLNLLESTEKVISDNSDKLDEYQEAYEKINKYYKDLKYYDTEVTREDNSVTRSTTINYDKIDIDILLDIEGEEDNIIEDKEAKVQLWLDLAKKFGTKCKKVTE